MVDHIVSLKARALTLSVRKFAFVRPITATWQRTPWGSGLHLTYIGSKMPVNTEAQWAM